MNAYDLMTSELAPYTWRIMMTVVPVVHEVMGVMFCDALRIPSDSAGGSDRPGLNSRGKDR